MIRNESSAAIIAANGISVNQALGFLLIDRERYWECVLKSLNALIIFQLLNWSFAK
jgi:hypothetical protein